MIEPVDIPAVNVAVGTVVAATPALFCNCAEADHAVVNPYAALSVPTTLKVALTSKLRNFSFKELPSMKTCFASSYAPLFEE